MNEYADHSRDDSWTRFEILGLVVASIVVFASRLPWTFTGLGADPDSFRVFSVAKRLLETGHYSYSRAPGNPVHEYLTAAMVPHAPMGTNLISVILCVTAFICFSIILRKIGVKYFLSGAMGFVFTPIVYINSVSTIDYVPAISFILAALCLLLYRKAVLAGICLGLAVGCRITSGAMLVPLALWVVMDSTKGSTRRQLLKFVTTTLLVSLICFMPVLKKYGLSFFTFADNAEYPELKVIMDMGFLSVWGTIGTFAIVGLFCAVLFYMKRIVASLKERETRKLLLLGVVSILLYVLAFLRLPHDAGYLIPVIPFVIMIFGLTLPSSFLRLFACALVLSSFLAVGKSGVTLNGPIVQNHKTRLFVYDNTRKIINAVDQLPDNALVVVGSALPSINNQLSLYGRKSKQYLYLIRDQKTLSAYQEKGKQIYFTPHANNNNIKYYNLDLSLNNAQELILPVE